MENQNLREITSLVKVQTLVKVVVKIVLEEARKIFLKTASLPPK